MDVASKLWSVFFFDCVLSNSVKAACDQCDNRFRGCHRLLLPFKYVNGTASGLECS